MIVLSLCTISSTSAVCGVLYSGEIMRTTDSGQSWSRVHIGNGTKYCGVYAITKSPTTGTLIATTGDNQIWVLRSTDNGATWTEIQQLTAETIGYSVVGLDNGRFLAGTGPTDSDVWKSDDDGLTWTLVIDLGQARTSALVDCGGGVVLAGTSTSEYIYRSTDYGSTWGTFIDANTTGTYVMALLKIPGTDIVLAGGGQPATVSRSINNGTSFSTGQQLNAVGYVTDFCLVGTDILACVREAGEIWKSSDNGITWTRTQLLPCSEAAVQVVKALSTTTILAGGRYTGIPMVSTDAGTTFSFGKIYPENKVISFSESTVYGRAYGIIDIPMHDEKLYTTFSLNTPFASFASNVTFAWSDLSFPALAGTFQQPFRPAYFNGTSSIINMANNVGAIAEDATRPYFVCSFWFRPETIPTTDQVIFRSAVYSTYVGFEVLYMSDGGTGAKIKFHTRSYSETLNSVEYVFPTSPVDTWKHVGVCWNYNTGSAGTIKMFIDGLSVASTTGCDYTYAYYNYAATPTHKDTIGARHDGTTATLFYQGYLALLTLDFSDDARITTVLPAARYAAICGGFKDVHTRHMNATKFSIPNLRI